MKLFFWNKEKSKEIINNLKSIGKEIARIADVENKKDKTKKVIASVKSKIDLAKREIAIRAQEEKSKPYISLKYDSKIDKLSKEEIIAIDKLNRDLDDYQELLEASVSEEDVNEILELFQKEAKELTERERKNEAELQAMEKETLKSRKRTSSSVPNLRTKDGVPFKRVEEAAASLGGWIEVNHGSRHPFVIHFPKETRPIPLSADVSTTALARKIREQLFNSIASHKIPNTTKLRRALNSGNIHDSV
jgi:hypothetical protein